jgi:Zn-dependent peptidase ImmA (M78 family)
VTVLRRPFERARKLAREMHWECGADEPSKIDPFAIVGRRRLMLVFGKLDGATGQILRHGDRAVIRVSDQIVQLGRIRFTVAHESGHFLLGHRIPEEADLSRGTPPFSKHQEREADVFATEFLMPEAWVAPLCMGAPTLEAVHRIAKLFRTSVVASAVRFVELTSKPCAVSYVEDGRVVWARCSRSFAGRISPQMKLGAGAAALECTSSVGPAGRVVPSSAWFGSQSAPVPEELVEYAEVVPEPGWGGVLSLIDADVV